ncbi:hypothetical protein KGQ20_02920 [Catenulispora sp. NF23]|uniref:Uncharacterized protein n=1 Tax=Catenulispora pinistramenti TaxID=2705254 RepID=A0ABS5KQG5_9ACTN|nr:hypothetical protein [Catenulispora pinistramenti]MBS2531718.1 hypothetical protein [Catenulispora pinistramenti]MBS2548285.1 hypothetical protein [Catenulispora pinistramenti]
MARRLRDRMRLGRVWRTGAVAISGYAAFAVTADIIGPEVKVWALDWELAAEAANR